MAKVGLSARTHQREGALLGRWRAQFWKTENHHTSRAAGASVHY